MPVYYTNGSEFDDTFVGVGANRLRSLFEQLPDTPCVLFIDEIDALLKENNGPLSGGNQTQRAFQTLTDGLDARKNVLLIGATNVPNVIPAAGKRSGRFDREVEFKLPDEAARLQTLQTQQRLQTTETHQFETNLNFDGIAQKTDGFSQADLKLLLEESGRQAGIRIMTTLSENTSGKITQSDLDTALEVMLKDPKRAKTKGSMGFQV
jgi:cell division protease FtsH